MSAASDQSHYDRESRLAMESLRRPEELGASCEGAEFVRGPLLSFCCDAVVTGSIWRNRGIRTGLCSKCFETSTFREVCRE